MFETIVWGLLIAAVIALVVWVLFVRKLPARKPFTGSGSDQSGNGSPANEGLSEPE